MKRIVGVVLAAALSGCAQPGTQTGSYDPGRAMMLLQMQHDMRAQQQEQQRINMAPFLANLRSQQQSRPASFNCSPGLFGQMYCQ